MVSDLDDAKHGEISVMEGPHKAARLVETLLEAGFDQARIRVFTGDEMEMQVTHRPVVALVNSDAEASPDDAPAPAEQPAEAEAELVAATPKAKAELEEVTATPFVRDGVRFSSQFRSA
jgi:hypothetical protein